MVRSPVSFMEGVMHNKLVLSIAEEFKKLALIGAGIFGATDIFSVMDAPVKVPGFILAGIWYLFFQIAAHVLIAVYEKDIDSG
jgi:hypothetical protein